MEILYKNKDFLVINKPKNMPSQSDVVGSESAIEASEKALAELSEKPKLWLVHRLDRVVGGLLLFARTKESAAYFSELFKEGKVKKEYIAVAEGEALGGEMSDFIYKDTLTSKAYVVKSERRGAKKASLSYKPLAYKDGKTLVSINLETGRFHQIRVQFASRKMPLVGDKKYGNRDARAHFPALFASKIEFIYKGKHFSFSALPNSSEYPFNLFEKSNFEEI